MLYLQDSVTLDELNVDKLATQITKKHNIAVPQQPALRWIDCRNHKIALALSIIYEHSVAAIISHERQRAIYPAYLIP